MRVDLPEKFVGGDRSPFGGGWCVWGRSSVVSRARQRGGEVEIGTLGVHAAASRAITVEFPARENCGQITWIHPREVTETSIANYCNAGKNRHGHEPRLTETRYTYIQVRVAHTALDLLSTPFWSRGNHRREKSNDQERAGSKQIIVDPPSLRLQQPWRGVTSSAPPRALLAPSSRSPASRRGAGPPGKKTPQQKEGVAAECRPREAG